jgi:hypothetical protein
MRPPAKAKALVMAATTTKAHEIRPIVPKSTTVADRRDLAALDMLRTQFRLRVARRQDFAALLADIYETALRLEASGLEVRQ